MAHSVKKCHALLMPSGTYDNPDLKHLFIVCSDACEEGNHVLVSITGWTNHLCDGTTKLGKGDHPFLHKDSYVLYRKARVESSEAISKGVESGLFDCKDDISAQLVEKIMKGLCESIHTPKKVKKYAGCPAASTPSKPEKPAALGLKKRS